MRTKTKVCLGCLRQIDLRDDRCPFCGFDPLRVQNPRYLRVGTKLNDRYVVGKKLGEGGFGITYTGYDIVKKTPVAIKEYFPAGIAGRDTSLGRNNDLQVYDGRNGKRYEEGLERFAREGKTQSQLKHLEHVVNVYDYFEENRTGYLIMEFVPGITVHERVEREGVFSPEEMMITIRPLLKDLAIIHSKDLLHRDISPENIMLRPDGVTKLIDFGAARTVMMGEEQMDKSVTVLVRRQYTPKEQYLTKGNYGPWTDIYALCATVYYMLSGAEPMPALEREENDLLKPLIEVCPEVGKELSDVIEKGMAITIEDRFQSVEELLKKLSEVIPEESIRKISRIDRTIYVDREREGKKYLPRWKKRWIYVGVASVCILAVVFVLWNAGQIHKAAQKTTDVMMKEDVHETSVSSEEQSQDVTKSETSEVESKAEVPDVVGLKQKKALKVLKESGFVGECKRIESKKEKNSVVRQSVKAGKQKEKGTKIIVYVSRGEQKKVENEVSTPVPQREKAESKKTKNDDAVGTLDDYLN